VPRGRLLFPLTVELAQLDTDAVQTAGGYDPDFKTYKPTGSGRQEKPVVRLLAQIEMSRWEGQQQLQGGNQPDSRLALVFHFRELEQKNLIDPVTGEALIRVNDRLVAIYSRNGATKEQSVRVPSGGLYATEVQPAGLGLGGRRNLLLVVFDERPQGLTANP
jgi:hypothetical protein